MRSLLVLVTTVAFVTAQTPTAKIINESRPGATNFQVGDRFRIVITGAANQSVSVRTSRISATDWGPVIGQTGANGWSTTGQFENSDFGYWSEAWTVGGRLASPVLNFSVDAPCLPGGMGSVMRLGAATLETCQTANGTETFGAPSYGESFRTADGRVVTEPASTPEQYRMRRLESLMLNDQDGQSSGLYGDEVGALITKLIGVNALSEDEMVNAVRLIHKAYKQPKFIPPAQHAPIATLPLLKQFDSATQQESLKRQIAETVNYVQLQ